ncbi:MAG: class I SAM-dependent methyltransferase [Eubacteriaceae bacterium]|nr:class I SAM-dependent methyltransferase [Eubacteriaceae bacterium]
MNVMDFEELWDKIPNERELSDLKSYWDLRAEEFNADKTNNCDYAEEILLEKGLINSENHILDIGCGPGKCAIKLSDRVKSVTGIDISENMIALARNNALEMNVKNVSFEVMPWEKADLGERGWEKKFDIVLASMTPGISSAQTLEKMNQASRGYCFLSSFVQRRDLMLEIKEHLGESSTAERQENKIYIAFNILWLSGYYPEIIYRDVEINSSYTFEKACRMYSRQFSADGEKSEKIRKFLLERVNDEGMIQQQYMAKIAWMYWKINARS